MNQSRPLVLLLTGATGLVGEGVLLECLESPFVGQVRVLTRRATGRSHPKLEELVVPDFFQLDVVKDRLAGLDACLYCAGISSAGMSEADYTRTTFDTPLHVAGELLPLNPSLVFVHVSGGHTDATEKGRVMWARVKGRAENALARMPFKAVYNFRPALMQPSPGQLNVRGHYRAVAALYPVLKHLMPGSACTLREVGQAMLQAVRVGAPTGVLEVPDIRALAAAAKR